MFDMKKWTARKLDDAEKLRDACAYDVADLDKEIERLEKEKQAAQEQWEEANAKVQVFYNYMLTQDWL